MALSDPDFYVRLGRRIAEARKAGGLTQERLAEGASISPSYLAHIEAGGRRPTLDVLRLLADALGVEIERLLSEGQTYAGAGGRPSPRMADAIDGLAPEDAALVSALANRLKAPQRSSFKRRSSRNASRRSKDGGREG
jgi:transcriptional regulator with XRE-family HTH domain